MGIKENVGENLTDEMKVFLSDKISNILVGIDKDEIDNGWWETSKGAEFGKEKLRQILEIFR